MNINEQIKQNLQNMTPEERAAEFRLQCQLERQLEEFETMLGALIGLKDDEWEDTTAVLIPYGERTARRWWKDQAGEAA